MKKKRLTDVERQMGQIVLDFANAETTDAACFKHFENVQEFAEKTKPFSLDFAERAKETFPAFHPLHSSLTNSEREFLRLTIQKQELKSFVNRDLESAEFGIECYETETSALTVLALDFDFDFLEGSAQGGVSGSTPVEMTVDEFKHEIKADVGTMLPSGIIDGIDEFVEIENQISTLKNSISEPRLNELQEIMSDYEKRGKLHNRILDLKKGLQNILAGIVENTAFYKLPGFGNYLDKYSELPLSRFMVTEDLLIEIPPISEDFYFDRSGRDRWFSRFQTELAYCLIGFLRGEGNRNYIKQCVMCEDFIIVKDVRRQACYPPKPCEKERKRKWSRELMRKKRDPDSPKFDPKYVS